ncbi:hypothetical protein CDD81_2914 [Ophiocordyceps australis]|uniref:Peptidase S8/S53 domain-containing protein n=1 Tax=Ophiocordyceps australis TaxID=1399860 RepID=A0A2C5YCA8_9HYPO|nr:hypothetical protein CDD81_2914 [Ophiocordyceps australis]
MAVAWPAWASAATQDVIPGAYLFEMEKGYETTGLIERLGDEGSVRLRLDYKLFKGVSIQIFDGENAEATAEKLAGVAGVKKYWPVSLYSVPEPKIERVGRRSNSSEQAERRGIDWWGEEAGYGNTSYLPHVMTQVDRLRAEGYTGRGIKIAVIDSGIDYTHPALGNGCFGKGCLVSFGTDLVGDGFTGSNKPEPGGDPMDCSGHGTHVAGIIAAQPNRLGFTGAAPGVRLGAYRVFGCTGQSSFDVLISAFNQAFEDGADMISASIVGVSGWKDEPWAAAVSRIAEEGVPCVVSSGNDGSMGLFYVSTAANGRQVTAIAAFDNGATPTLLYRSRYRVDGQRGVEFGYAPGDETQWKVSQQLWTARLNGSGEYNGCAALPGQTEDLSQRIVLLQRGECTFAQKVNNVAARGARRVIFYNNVDGAFAPELGDAAGRLQAVAMVQPQLGQAWMELLRQGHRVTVDMAAPSINDSYTVQGQTTAAGGALSAMTSWGPTWEMDVKPQFGAPGSNILSTYPVAKGGYVVLSGTSMACPLAAAIMALVGQVRGSLDPELLTSLLSATAKPQLLHDGTRFRRGLAPVPQQGGGLLQAWDAAHASTRIAPASLSFNDSDHLVRHRSFTISNLSRQPIEYRLAHRPALTMYTLAPNALDASPFPNHIAPAAAHLSFSSSTVLVPPGQNKSVSLFLHPPLGLVHARLPLWSGYITLNASDGTSLSLPYQGLAGSLRAAAVLARNQTWITKSADVKAQERAPADAHFVLPRPRTLAESDSLPALVVNLALGSRLMRAHVVALGPLHTSSPPTTLFAAASAHRQSLGQLHDFPSRWNPRGKRIFAWNGKLHNGKWAAPGRYVIVVRALRIFGHENVDREWDVSETLPFSISYQD